MENKHSFVVLAYQESPYLEACLQSLLQQTLKSDILITTSTPNFFLKNIAKKYKLKLLINPKPSGIASDWNFALGQAETKYVTLAHQDDIYLENYTAEMLKNLEKYPDFLIKFSDYQEIYQSKLKEKIRTWNLNLLIKRLINLLFWPTASSLTKQKSKLNFLKFGSSIPCPSVLYNKQQLTSFQFSKNFTTNLDWLSWINLAKQKGEFLRSKKILMQHRIHQDSTTSLWIANKKRYQEDLFCFKQLWPKKVAKLLAKTFTLSWKNNQ